MTITSSSGLSDSEIERMVQESEKFAEADKAKQAVIEQSNKAEGFTQEIEKNLQEFEAQLDATEKETVKKLVAELREMAAAGLRGDDITPEALKEKYDEVSGLSSPREIRIYGKLTYFPRPRRQTQQASLGLFKKVYEQRAAAGNADSEPASGESTTEGDKKN